MSTFTTQQQALAELHQLSAEVTRLTGRYDGGGAAVKAEAAWNLSSTFRMLAALYRGLAGLYRGNEPTRWLMAAAATDAAELNTRRAAEWSSIADMHQAEADRITRVGEAAFADDGMVYIPGRGRLRRQVKTEADRALPEPAAELADLLDQLDAGR